MKKSLLVLTILASLPFAASAADGLSYNYLEGGYAKTDLQNPDYDGWALKGSVSVAKNFHVFGDYSGQEMDYSYLAGKIDFDQWRLGVGYNHELSQRVDLLARVAYAKTPSTMPASVAPAAMAPTWRRASTVR